MEVFNEPFALFEKRAPWNRDERQRTEARVERDRRNPPFECEIGNVAVEMIESRLWTSEEQENGKLVQM